MEPLDPAALIAVTLKAADWNAVLAALAEAPYRIAAPLIAAIGAQAMAAANGSAGLSATAEDGPRVSN